MPPAVDLEFVGNCATRPKPDELRLEIENFLTEVEAHAGRPAIFYATKEFLSAYGAVLPLRPLWIRSVMRTPPTEDWLFWQYHEVAGVSGIETRVDVDVYRFDLSALRELTGVAASAGQ